MAEKEMGEHFAHLFGRDWKAWQRLNQLPALAIQIPATITTDKLLASGSGIWTGYGMREVSGGTGVGQLFDGADATGNLLAEFTITANGNVTQAVPAGLRFRSGLWLHFLSGNAGLRGSVFAKLMNELEGDGEFD